MPYGGATAYREKIFEFDEFAAAAESGRLNGRQVSDLVVPADRLARLDVFRSRHDLQDHGRPTHLLVGVERSVLPCHTHTHAYTYTYKSYKLTTYSLTLTLVLTPAIILYDPGIPEHTLLTLHELRNKAFCKSATSPVDRRVAATFR